MTTEPGMVPCARLTRQLQAGSHLDGHGDIALLFLDKDVVGAADHGLVVIDVQHDNLQHGGGRQVPAVRGQQREVVHGLLLPIQQLTVSHRHCPRVWIHRKDVRPVQGGQVEQIKIQDGASLVAQWLRICLLMQGTRVRALVWEDPTCHGATKPVSHNY